MKTTTLKNSISRRKFIRNTACGVGTLALSPWLYTCARDLKDRPNFIFIMSDDHAAQALSCYGSTINQTPNLDRLAEEGMLFENTFCTNSICAPSRASILTGKMSHLNGVRDNTDRFDGAQTTFPKLLRGAGYQTALIGKWHLKSDPTGFDYWNTLIGQGAYHDPVLSEMGVRKEHTGYATDIITDLSLDWLQTRRKGKPFCLLLHHKAPHRNWQPDEKHASMYEDIDIPEPATFNDDWSTRSRAAREQWMTIADHLDVPYDTKIEPPPGLKGQELKQWKYQRYIKDYLRCVASIDDNIGRLLDYLDQSGLTENTVVIYTSDQGFFLGEHGWYDKRFMYEESLRMPLMVRWPGHVPAGARNDELVANLDFAPTLLSLGGVTIPEDIQGRSMESLMVGDVPEDWRDAVYYHYTEFPDWHMVKRHYGLRTQRYKLIHFYWDIDAWELYDLKTDPDELNNLIGNPAYAQVLAELKEKLSALREQYRDSSWSERFIETYLEEKAPR
ncbi:sulfatase [Candidatus Neomarinimicrobiota bacterium]